MLALLALSEKGGNDYELTSFRMKTKPEFMIIPMIDIIFFLLVFFMMNSLQTIAQKALSVQVTTGYKRHLHRLKLPVVLTLDAEGILRLIMFQ